MRRALQGAELQDALDLDLRAARQLRDPRVEPAGSGLVARAPRNDDLRSQ